MLFVHGVRFIVYGVWCAVYGVYTHSWSRG